MGGIFGVASKSSCVLDLFFGIDYHSHLGKVTNTFFSDSEAEILVWEDKLLI